MYAIYNEYGDLVSISQQPDAVLESVLLPHETLEAAISAGYVVSSPVRQTLALNQLSRFQRGFIIRKSITDIRTRKVTRIGVI